MHRNPLLAHSVTILAAASVTSACTPAGDETTSSTNTASGSASSSSTNGSTNGNGSSSSSTSTTTSSDGTTTTTTVSSGGGSSSSVSSSSSTGSSSTGSGSAISESRANGARSLDIDNDVLTFSYAYPAEAGAIPPLAKLLDRRLDKARGGLEKQAREARSGAQADDYPYRKHTLDVTWKVITDLPGWLSLSAGINSYSGGAHSNQGYDSLIWDKREGRPLDPMDMFTSPAALRGATEKAYCAALDRERKRRNGAVSRNGFFPDCPKLNELTLFIGSRGRTKFDRIELVAGPYVAGAYAEGTYAVTLPVDKAILRAVKPEYRPAFAVR